ncbi:MAG: glycosyltransferase [Variovorax sp.]
MLISILIPAYARPDQLGTALESIAQQDRSVIGEILIGDDSPRRFWASNQEVIAASGLAELVEYIPSEPSRGTYPNQWFLASRAKFDHLLFLHNDDQLCPGALNLLTTACAAETDPHVKLWFGTHLIMNEPGVIDAVMSDASDRWYGRNGPEATRPLWEWCLTESIPSNAFLVQRASYLRHMRGERDGNVGDWGFAVRLANSGAHAHFVGQTVSRYRVQAGSVTNSGRGVDAHRTFELAHQLRVPAEFEAMKRKRFYQNTLVVAVRYARDGERAKAWRSLFSPDVPWRRRFSVRAVLVVMMLSTPRPLWLWALRYKD